MISTTATEAPSRVGASAVRGTSAVAGGTTAAAHATGLPVGPAVRLRPVVDVPPAGRPVGAVAPSSDIPGELSPRDPLS